jgi:hypothetical protein
MKFGSRMDVFVPASATLLVKPGEKVLGALTVLARLQTTAPEGRPVTQ